MMHSSYKWILVLAAGALTTLLVTQSYWFYQAYRLEEKQFDTQVNIALRYIADTMLDAQGDRHSTIPPVEHNASNAYSVHLRGVRSYDEVDSLVKVAFTQQGIRETYILALLDVKADALILGSLHTTEVKPETIDTAACLGRKAQLPLDLDLSIVFPDKQASIVGAHNFWLITVAAIGLLLIIAGYVILDLYRQKELATIKNDFINNMTHELKTPIANIAIASEVLRNPKTQLHSERMRQYADIVHQENIRLKHHVEQVLRTVQMEKGQVTMDLKMVDLNALLSEVIEKFKLRVLNRDGNLTTSLAASHSVVNGDVFHLQNLFYNLLDNADKYSPQAPQISVHTENRENGIEVQVIDHGQGIPSDKQKFIFDKFYRVASGDQHDIAGFGMGLSYVQQIVNAHGGKIGVDSSEERGSCFKVWFQTLANAS